MTTDILLNTPTENGLITLINVTTTDASLIGNTVSGASFLDGTRLEDALLNNSNVSQDITYEFQVSGNGCVNTTTSSTNVTVKPTPEMTVVNNNPTLCSAWATDIVVNSITADAIIELVNITISPDASGITGFTSTGTTWASSASELPGMITDNLINSTDSLQTITYEFEVSASGFTSTKHLRRK